MKHTVRFEPSGRSIEVDSGSTLLEAAREAGLPVASACGAKGVCSRCGMQILDGSRGLMDETPREHELKLRNRIDSSLRLSCWTRVDCDLLVTAPYW